MSLKFDFPDDVIDITFIPPVSDTDDQNITIITYPEDAPGVFTESGLYQQEKGKFVNTPNGLAIQEQYFVYVDRNEKTINIATGWRVKVQPPFYSDPVYFRITSPFPKTGIREEPYVIQIDREPGQAVNT